MNYSDALILGFVQGITEFLPVSSSAHLVIIQSLSPKFSQPGVLFDVLLHLGTLFAVLIYLRKDILRLSRSYFVFLVLGTLPAVFVGLLFSDFLESVFSRVSLVGFALLLTGFFNFYLDRLPSANKRLNNRNSVFVGIFQAMAIVPGISRSGSTIFAGVKSGLSRKEAARFSFLLSVPAIIGANFLQFFKYGFDFYFLPGVYIFGFLVSFLSGLLGIYLAFRFLLSRSFRLFSIYCFLLGIVTIFFFR